MDKKLIFAGLGVLGLAFLLKPKQEEQVISGDGSSFSPFDFIGSGSTDFSSSGGTSEPSSDAPLFTVEAPKDFFDGGESSSSSSSSSSSNRNSNTDGGQTQAPATPNSPQVSVGGRPQALVNAVVRDIQNPQVSVGGRPQSLVNRIAGFFRR